VHLGRLRERAGEQGKERPGSNPGGGTEQLQHVGEARGLGRLLNPDGQGGSHEPARAGWEALKVGRNHQGPKIPDVGSTPASARPGVTRQLTDRPAHRTATEPMGEAAGVKPRGGALLRSPRWPVQGPPGRGSGSRLVVCLHPSGIRDRAEETGAGGVQLSPSQRHRWSPGCADRRLGRQPGWSALTRTATGFPGSCRGRNCGRVGRRPGVTSSSTCGWCSSSSHLTPI
jgi:hypothetical protein